MPKIKLRKEDQIMIYGYGRVSTKGQAKDGNSLEAQERLLKEHGAEVIYMDSFIDTKMTRPEFDKLLKELKAGDTLVVAKLDRFARSVSQASDLITKLIDEGIRVDVCNLGILDNARQNPDFREGRPKKYSRMQINHALELLEHHSYKQVEAMTGNSKSTLIRARRKEKSPV